MTKNEFELLRICRSAELAYFMSEHTLEKPKFIQSWFKNKVKVDRQDLTNEQIQTICSEWQLKQKTFYKKYKGFVDLFDKVIQNLQYLNEENDSSRINSMVNQLTVIGAKVINGLDPEQKVDRENMPELDPNGVVVITEDQNMDGSDNLTDGLQVEIQTVDAKRFYYILDIIRIHGFDSCTRDKYIAGEWIKIKLTSSKQNEYNAKVIDCIHGREQDWREELAKTHKKPA